MSFDYALTVILCQMNNPWAISQIKIVFSEENYVPNDIISL